MASFGTLMSCRQHSFELARLQEQLSMDEESALALAAELQTQGYIKPSEKGLYNFTDKGRGTGSCFRGR